MNDSPRKLGLASIEVAVPGSARHGRVFLPASRLGSVDFEALAVDFGRSFVDEDDESRLELLTEAMALRAVTVETYPGETSPVEFHVYLRATEVSAAPIFACVLATTAVVEHLLTAPPHVVLETASFQVIGDDGSPAFILAGLQAWAARVWPGAALPRFRLVQWPENEVATLLPLPRIHLAAAPMTGAPELLNVRDFPTPEDLQHL